MSTHPIPLRPDYAAAARAQASATLNTATRMAMYFAGGNNAVERAQKERPHDHALIEALKRGTIRQRSASAPADNANITVLNSTNVNDVRAIAPMSAFSALAGRAIGVNFDTPTTSQSIPGVTVSAAAVTFVAQGASIPVMQLAFDDVVLTPKKVATITALTSEIMRSSNAEAILKQVLSESISLGIDAKMLDNVEGDDVRPSGIRYDIAALTATDAGALALLTDINQLVAAVSLKAGNIANIVIVCDPVSAMKIAVSLPMLTIPVIATGGLAPDTVMAVACNCLAIGAGNEIRVRTTQETAIHMVDADPTDISTAGSPQNLIAAPARSLFQTDAHAIRLTFDIDWKMRTASGAVAWTENHNWT